MSMFRKHLYNVKFNFKSLEASCQRTSCKVYIQVQMDNQERELENVAQMKKNIAVFNNEMVWEEVPINYDQMSGTYIDFNTIISFYYQTNDQSYRTNKLKIGQVTINLAKLLNSKTYRLNTNYALEKCYDSNARLKLSIDFAKTDEIYRHQIEKKQRDFQTSHVTSTWKMSKIREKMNEQQKVLLKNKLEQYEAKLDRIREENSEHSKKLIEQNERKEQKISSLTAQKNTLVQTVHSLESTVQKLKIQKSSLQNELNLVSQQLKSAIARQEQQVSQLAIIKQELSFCKQQIKQGEQARDKKQVYYKNELQKYLQKYMQSENNRNKIIFELEAKLKEELEKKEAFYTQQIQKLQSKNLALNQNHKQVFSKKDKEMVALNEKISLIEKEKLKLKFLNEELEEENQRSNETSTNLLSEIQKLKEQIKSTESQCELSRFRNKSLQQELHKEKVQKKQLVRKIEENLYELQLSKGTVQEQSRMIVKLNKQIKQLREKQFYLTERYEDELGAKVENEEQILGTNSYYLGIIKKYSVQASIYEQKLDEFQSTIKALQRQKQQIEREKKNKDNEIFILSEKVVRLQNERSKMIEKQSELQVSIQEKNILIDQLEHKLERHFISYEGEIGQYKSIIEELESQVRNLERSQDITEQQVKQKLQNQKIEKKQIVKNLEGHIQKLKAEEVDLRQELQGAERKIEDQARQLQQEKQRSRVMQRQILKNKLDITKLNEEEKIRTKQIAQLKENISQIKKENATLKGENTKFIKKMSLQRESFNTLMKWIFQRVWEDSKREYLQQASYDIEIDLLSFVNTGLQKIYKQMDKLKKQVVQKKHQIQRLNQQLAEHNLQSQYQHEFIKQYGINKEKGELQIFPVTHSFNGSFQKNSQFKNFSSNLTNLGRLQQGMNNEVGKVEQLKISNYQLQRDLSLKITEIEALSEEIFEERTKVRELTEEIKTLHQDIEDLNNVISKKSSLVTALQAQLSTKEDDLNSFASSYRHSPPRKSDVRAEAQAKFKDQRLISQLEGRIKELEQQNLLQKSKIELLQNRQKLISQKTSLDSTKISANEKNLKEGEETIKKLRAQNRQKINVVQKLEKDLQLITEKLNKKVALIQQLEGERTKDRKQLDLLQRRLEQCEIKIMQKENTYQNQRNTMQNSILELTESLSNEKLEKDKTNMQLVSQIANLKNVLKQSEKRVMSLQKLLQKAKAQNDQLYQKYLKLLNDYNEGEEAIKDLKANEKQAKKNFEKSIEELQEKLVNKGYQIEQLRFSLESKIMQLEKQMQERQKSIISY